MWRPRGHTERRPHGVRSPSANMRRENNHAAFSHIGSWFPEPDRLSMVFVNECVVRLGIKTKRLDDGPVGWHGAAVVGLAFDMAERAATRAAPAVVHMGDNPRRWPAGAGTEHASADDHGTRMDGQPVSLVVPRVAGDWSSFGKLK